MVGVKCQKYVRPGEWWLFIISSRSLFFLNKYVLDTPVKVNMEFKNHRNEKGNRLNQTSIDGFHVIFPSCIVFDGFCNPLVENALLRRSKLGHYDKPG